MNFGKGQHILLQPFVPKGKPSNSYDRTRKGLGYVTPPPHLSLIDRYHRNIQIHLARTLMVVWG